MGVATATATATWYAVVGGNDHYWRVEAPARAVAGKAVLLPETAHPTRDERGRYNGRAPSGWYCVTQENDDTIFPWRVYADRNDPDYMEVRYPAHEGVAVWTRPDFLRAKHAFAMQCQGIRTLAEVDDNYLSDPKLNVFQRAQGYNAEARDQHMKATAFMDGIVVSTHWLRDHYYKTLKNELGVKNVPDIFVCGNHVAASDWPARIERDGPLRVGWMGSGSHVWDIHIAYKAFKHARMLGCDRWMIGYDPADPQLDPDSPFYAEAKAKAEQWKTVGHSNVPWRKPGQYERFPLPFDIGLCPLLRNTHTLGKSDVKFLEYTIAGAATIASNNEVYSRTIVHGETGLLVGGEEEMWRAVDQLARDEEFRLRLVRNAQQYVREERNSEVMAREWMEAING